MRGRARCLRALGGTSYQPGAMVLWTSRMTGFTKRLLQRRHLNPLSLPALVIREPQSGQNGLSRTVSRAAETSSSFSRLIHCPLNDPVTLIRSPGMRARIVCLNCFVGSKARHVILPGTVTRKKET